MRVGKGGGAEIRVPDLDELQSLRASSRIDEKEYARRIFGDQGHPGDFHFAGFTLDLMTEHFRETGFELRRVIPFNGNITYLVRC